MSSIPPTEYRLALPDELNRFALMLSRGFDAMAPAEVVKLARQFEKPMALGPKPPTAKQLTHCLSYVGLLYIKAIGEAAEQRRKDVGAEPPLTTHAPDCICTQCEDRR